MNRRLVLPAFAMLTVVGCSGSRVNGNFLGIETNVRCVERDFIGEYWITGNGHSLGVRCDVDRGNDRWTRIVMGVQWDFGEDMPSTVVGTDERDSEQDSIMRTDDDPRAYLHHEITIHQLDATTGDVRGVAHAWSERSDFEFRFSGQVEVFGESPE